MGEGIHGNAALLFCILWQLVSEDMSCHRGEQKPVVNQLIGLKSCSVNKALGTILNVLRWPIYQNPE